MIRRTLSRLDFLQNQRRFQILATIVVAVLAIGGYSGVWIAGNAPKPVPTTTTTPDTPQTLPARPVAKPRSWIEAGPIGAFQRVGHSVLVQVTSTEGAVAVGFAFLAAAFAAIIVVWLGLSLSYLAILIIGWTVAWPLMTIGATRTLGQILMGLVPLALAFLTLIQAARVALYGSNPILAIARNVLNEAVRMKISVVFIVLLLLLMALIPNSLTEDQPLRYRVQQWLSYGLGFSYAVLALLTVFLSVATVTFEQRDKIIWQTATKPVASWQYVLGKWLGVMTLNLVLLSVASGGVYIFTEYLRHQPAEGESAYYVDLRGNHTGVPDRQASLDRRILERQVLVARVGIRPEPQRPTDLRLDIAVQQTLAEQENPPPGEAKRIREEMLTKWNDQIQQAVQSEVDERSQRDPGFVPTEAVVGKIRADILRDIETAYRSVDPGGHQEYVFDTRELYKQWDKRRRRILAPVQREVDRIIKSGEAPESDRNAVADRVLHDFADKGRIPRFPELTLRYQINSGTNDPTKIYRLYFFLNGAPYPITSEGRPAATEVALKAAQTLNFPIVAIDEEGILSIGVVSDPSNERTLTFPPDGLEILYSVGGYELNFLRVIAVMWIKLGFIAAVGVAAGTFLSFSVASLVTLGILFMAESSGFLSTSLEYYSVKTLEGDISWIKVFIRAISLPIAWTFQVYADLKPTERLVDGRLISWSSLAMAIGVIGAWTLVMLSIGLAIFRKRELAIYSGQ